MVASNQSSRQNHPRPLCAKSTLTHHPAPSVSGASRTGRRLAQRELTSLPIRDGGEQLAHSISHSPSALFFGSSPLGSGLRLLLRREEETRRQRRAHGLTPAGARVHAKQHVHRCGQREHARTVHRLGRAACAMHAPTAAERRAAVPVPYSRKSHGSASS